MAEELSPPTEEAPIVNVLVVFPNGKTTQFEWVKSYRTDDPMIWLLRSPDGQTEVTLNANNVAAIRTEVVT